MDKAMHAIWNMKFTCTPRSDLPGLPRHIISTIIGGRGKDYDLRGSAYLSDHCTIITEVRFLPGMSVESVRQDIIRELEKIRTSDPQFKYEIQGPPIPFRNRRYSRQPVEVPKNAEIVQIVKNNHKTVTGKDVEKVGIIPPFVYGGTDACHFYEVGIPSISYGPGELAVNGLAHCEQYVKIDDMMTCAKTLALTAVDVCG
jgi:acetylornithine deacetylase/succinyl-diaminopimelate desuccinylase-like protein